MRLSQGLDLVLAQKLSVFAEGDTVNMMGAQYESSLFSSSLSELFSRKCKPGSLLMFLDISFLLLVLEHVFQLVDMFHITNLTDS